MKFLSSAKINLNLEVNSETKDGLHTLTSYLIPIDFYDVIEINEIEEKNDKIIFTPDIELKGKSTIEKSLDLVRESNSFEKYFEVKVTKNSSFTLFNKNDAPKTDDLSIKFGLVVL